MSLLTAVLYYCLPHLVFALVFLNWDAEKAVHLLLWAKNALLCENHGLMSYWIRYVIVPLVRALKTLEKLLGRCPTASQHLPVTNTGQSASTSTSRPSSDASPRGMETH
jgi:hypothetical protein